MRMVKDFNGQILAADKKKSAQGQLDEAINENIKGDIVIGRQSNHQSWTYPLSLGEIKPVHLYMAIAYWGLIKGSPFSQKEVSEAFRIPPRSAGDAITYIVKFRKNIISSKKVITKHFGKKETKIRILSINLENKVEINSVGSNVPGVGRRKKRGLVKPSCQKREESFLAMWFRLRNQV
ncbi:TPA: CaiF/GrlA family transcriptional regulator [Yersinia enterocolitica]|nr:CaiF/GrlA family transcriptional regulator [Yersinia enterocolitica]HDL6968301.1 CaiF/GrlA family transcriptional regulator [Yersinia enterocolitica]HDL6972511.1 CaiF/GrlA family transcriptional regulator [Yersinia enterocolitica]HDL6976664.1 CaiF/GrlA family transcriptional regulator [Yersinia enterocolitica]HDL6989019.1 CaiF/GrlA family transcriptional regulator [Yersinia enterocolitica]HDL6997681.1 CaiF/GrlA family transcriptional regulator [Yersinia enterocolitica]